MTCKFRTLLSFAVLAAATALPACATDDSLPSRPRTSTPFTPDPQAQDNAEKRVLEKPARDMPTSGAEFPGRSSLAPVKDPPVLLMQASPGGNSSNINLAPAPAHGFIFPGGKKNFGQTQGPSTVYNKDYYPGPLPHLPANPGTVPMPGSTPAPGGDWDIDHSWGQGLVLENYPHRAWPEINATYESGQIKNNPTYYYNIQEHLKVKQNEGSFKGDWISNAYEVPWFFMNTAALPVLMVLEPPLAQRTSERQSADPNYRGYLPDGPTVPVPAPGDLHWDYPFLNADGSVKDPNAIPTTTTTAPAAVPGGGI